VAKVGSITRQYSKAHFNKLSLLIFHLPLSLRIRGTRMK